MYPAHIPEDPLPGEDPVVYVTRLARQKAEAVFSDLTAAHPKPEENEQSPLVVLGADTTVTLDNAILGKPEDAADAARKMCIRDSLWKLGVFPLTLATSKPHCNHRQGSS